jgi:hypothetical protein
VIKSVTWVDDMQALVLLLSQCRDGGCHQRASAGWPLSVTGFEKKDSDLARVET